MDKQTVISAKHLKKSLVSVIWGNMNRTTLKEPKPLKSLLRKWGGKYEQNINADSA